LGEFGSSLELRAEQTSVGDTQGNGFGTALTIRDDLQRITLVGQLATDQAVSASGPVGTIVAKLPIHDAAGDLLGYLPVYDGIT